MVRVPAPLEVVRVALAELKRWEISYFYSLSLLTFTKNKSNREVGPITKLGVVQKMLREVAHRHNLDSLKNNEVFESPLLFPGKVLMVFSRRQGWNILKFWTAWDISWLFALQNIQKKFLLPPPLILPEPDTDLVLFLPPLQEKPLHLLVRQFLYLLSLRLHIFQGNGLILILELLLLC